MFLGFIQVAKKSPDWGRSSPCLRQFAAYHVQASCLASPLLQSQFLVVSRPKLLQKNLNSLLLEMAALPLKV